MDGGYVEWEGDRYRYNTSLFFTFQGVVAVHSLLPCSDFIEIRESHFTAKSLRMLFKDISPEKIFNFLKEINISGKI